MSIGSASIGSASIGGLPKPTTFGVRTLSSEITGLASTMNQNDGVWCHLYDIVVETGTVLYKTDYPKSLVYNGTTYSPYPIRMDGIPYTAKPENKTFTINVANIDKTIATYLEQGKLLGNDVTISWVFVRKDNDDIVLSFQDKYQILGGEISEESAFAAFECGRQNLFKEKLPHNRWIDFRCGHIYKAPGTCNYLRDEFGGTSRWYRNYAGISGFASYGSDGLKHQGWYTYSLNKVMRVGSGVYDSGFNFVYAPGFVVQRAISPTSVTTNPLEFSTTNSTGFLYYKKIPTGLTGQVATDFDFEAKFSSTLTATGYSEGIFLCSDSSFDNWVHLCRQYISGNVNVVGYHKSAGTETQTFATVSTNSYLRIVKVGNDFQMYHKATESSAWILGGTVTNANLHGITLRTGIAYEEFNNPSSFFASFCTYFRFNSGGYITCQRTLADCRVRENVRRFGGAPGILHGPLYL